MKRFNICSNIDNQCGLQADAELLRDLLTSWGHQVKLIHYRKRNQVEEAPNVDANIFLEVVNYDLIARHISRENWFIPNPEWLAPWDHKNGLPDFDKVLCKTQDAVRILTRLTAEYQKKVRFIGFESEDMYDPNIPRERRFLHVAGQSRYKNTMATTYAFARMMQDEDVKPQLTIVGAYPDEYAFGKDAPNIKTYERVSDDEMRQLMNSHLFHLMPAGYEGWGHALHESLGVGAVVITTNHPPMNEFEGVAKDLLVPYQDVIPELAAMRARVVAAPVRDIVKKALRMKSEQLDPIRQEARAAFLKEREEFRANFKKVVDEL
jgi:hypothetical protein